MKHCLILLLLLFTLWGCEDDLSQKIDSDIRLDCEKLDGFAQSNDMIPFLEDSVSISNALLGESVGFKLAQTWKIDANTQDLASNEIPVYLIETYPPNRIGIAAVPQNKKCILIDAKVVRNVSSYFTGYKKFDIDNDGNPLYLGDYPFYVYVMVFVLLHESGHINMIYFDNNLDNKKRDILCNRYLRVDMDQQRDPKTNVSCDRSKIIELAADLFAAKAIKSGQYDSTNRLSYEGSLRTQQSLHILGMSIIFEFAQRNKNNNNIRQQEEYIDRGKSHPNIELRILSTLAMINPDMESSLKIYLRSRQGYIEPYLVPKYNTLKSIDLVNIVKNDSNSLHERSTALDVLSERKDPIGISTIRELINSHKKLSGTIDEAEDRVLFNDMIRYLGVVKDITSISVFKEILENDYSFTSQLAALDALEFLDDGLIKYLESLEIKDKMLKSAVKSSINRHRSGAKNDTELK